MILAYVRIRRGERYEVSDDRAALEEFSIKSMGNDAGPWGIDGKCQQMIVGRHR